MFIFTQKRFIFYFGYANFGYAHDFGYDLVTKYCDLVTIWLRGVKFGYDEAQIVLDGVIPGVPVEADQSAETVVKKATMPWIV